MAEASKDVAGPVFSSAPYHLRARLDLCIHNDLFWHCLSLAPITASKSFPGLKNTVRRLCLFLNGRSEVQRCGVVGIGYSQKLMLNLLIFLLLSGSLGCGPWHQQNGCLDKGDWKEQKREKRDQHRSRKDSPSFEVAASREVSFRGFSRDLCEAYLRRRMVRGKGVHLQGLNLAAQWLHAC